MELNRRQLMRRKIGAEEFFSECFEKERDGSDTDKFVKTRTGVLFGGFDSETEV